MKSLTLVGAAMLIAIGGAVTLTQAQQPTGIKRFEAMRHDLGVADRTVIQVRVDFAPGASFGNHSHPGAEVAYVLEGTIEYQLQGRSPVLLNAGDALFIPAGVVHSARNAGTGNAAELATYIVEKDKPLVTLAK